jgi:CRISPR-associated protein Cas1
MRKLLNVVYVTSPNAYLARDGENLVIRSGGENKFRVPIHNLEGIVSFGYPGASPALMALCMERNVSISFVNEHGHFLARVTGPVSGNVLLRRRQYRMADNPTEATPLAATFVLGKVANCRTVLQRAIRDHDEVLPTRRTEEAAASLGDRLRPIRECHSIELLMGLEGECARTYFAALDDLILAQKTGFRFSGRSRRPPLDNMNALLSFLYGLLAHEVQSALETVGLDPAVGFLHSDRPGRPGLALDLMEELRPILADRLALSLINRKQVDASGFLQKESGGVLMDDRTRKTVLSTWHKRKQEDVTHPFLNEKVPIGLVPYAQALLLARYLRGDLDAYPPFFWK